MSSHRAESSPWRPPDANRKFVYLSVDGGKAFSLKNNDQVRVSTSKYTTRLVRLSKKSFCEILDKKMGGEVTKSMKNQRQEYLLQIIAEETVETQEQLGWNGLQERGIRSTQATISRDIKEELHLIKEPVGQGPLPLCRVRPSDKAELCRPPAYHLPGGCPQRGLRPEPGGHQDHAGSGQRRAPQRWTAWRFPIWSGSLAGDDTVLLVLRDNAAAAEFADEIKEMLR